MEWNFGNWDFEAWLMGMAPPMSEQARNREGLKSKSFGKYSNFLVFKYEYKPNVTRHGGVKVTYKLHLSDKGTAKEAEWLPIERSDKNGVMANVTTEDGVIFVPHPPDLRKEPLREEWELFKDQGPTGAYDTMRRVLAKRKKWELSNEAALDWMSLAEFQKDKTRAGMMPDMPHTFEVTGDESTAPYLEPGKTATRTFDGTPSKLLEILKVLRKGRFERPLITWNIFDDEPPHSFPSHPVNAVATVEEDDSEVDGDEETTDKPREPRLVNMITHDLNPEGTARRAQNSALMEEWVIAQPRRVEEPVKGDLYLVQLEEAEGEFHLGLCRVKSIDDGALIVYWYERVGRKHSWGYNGCNFKQFGKHGWAFDKVTPESILLEVKTADLTTKGRTNQLAKPTVSKDFMEKLRSFVDHHHNSVNNVLVADEEELPSDPPEVRAGPKARPTSSSRLGAAAGAARPMPESRATPAESSAAAAHRQAAAALVSVNAQRLAAAAEKQVTAAALKVQQAAKLAEKAAVEAIADAAVATWVASAGGGAAGESSTNPVDAAPASKRPKSNASRPATAMHESAPATSRPRKKPTFRPYHEPTLAAAAAPATAAVTREVGSKAAADAATSTFAVPPPKSSKSNQQSPTAAQGRPRRSGN